MAKLYGPVWRSLPQTPQVAEFCAYAAATQILAGPSTLHSDCSNVVKAANMGLHAALSWRRPNAGIVKATLKEQGRAHVAAVVKVKGHVEEAEVGDPRLKRHARGNRLADEYADRAVWEHPVLARNDTSVKAYMRKITCIAMTIAKTCKLWPKSKVTNGVVGRRPREAAPVRTVVHEDRQGVQPEPDDVSGRADASHYLMLSGQVLFCGVCGAYSDAQKSRKLTAPCRPRVPSQQTKKPLQMLMNGQHPRTGASMPQAKRVRL